MLLLLVLQGVLTFSLFQPDTPDNNAERSTTLLDVAVTSVNEIRISDGLENEVVLRREGEAWLLPELNDMPAEGERVAALLAALDSSGLWPVADSPAARQRFQVADYRFQRRLELFAGEALQATVYLGTSPGFRKVHARNAQQGAIYSIPLSNFAAPVTSGAWLDGGLLRVRSPLRIVSDGYSLNYADGQWLAGTGATPDARELQALLDALRNLQINGVAGEDEQRELSAAEADWVISVAGLTGSATLSLFERGGKHYIHSSVFPHIFTLSAYDYARLTDIDLSLISGG
ncbi:MAG: DUF4340 domain-containing protein [Halioglobus sp.]|nr:DUF4340 domain-containing protein [Halioglobus sp.]